MICTSCGADNDAARKFCRECGSRLSLACPACGAPNAADDKFCGECGSPLSSAEHAPAGTRRGDAADSTERRLVSVLFVDLVGFTSYSEGRDAEDVRSMLGQYFEGASDAVTRHGGTVEKFIGDAVMAVWGTPVAHEDDAERAVRSAIEIVDRVAVLGAQLGVALQARAGVLTGEAVATLDAVDQGLVTGDLVNTASRLQSAAVPGTVLVGERTYRSTSRAIAYEAVESLTLKGKTGETAAWRVLRVVGERGGTGRGDAPEPPFVGREDELRLVKELLHATGREGRSRLVHVTGVGGIGKSRLVWELTKYVDGLTEDVLWHQGRCPAYGDGVSFWALAEMVRTRAGIADTDDDPTAVEKLSGCLDLYVTDEDERAWLGPRLGHLLGLDPAPPGGRDELFGAWRRFFERVAERGTTVLVLEELHWADPGLLDFVESLLELSRTSPIVVLTLARPELTDRRASWGVGVRNATTIHVDPLAPEPMATMITGFVDGLPASAVDELVRRAEGVPLFAVETVRMLVERGVLEQDGGRYRVVGDAADALQDLDVPETLHALVAARLDSLPEAERWLVQDASVAGHTFTLETVCAVTGREMHDVEPSLRALVRKEVLDQDADPRSPERGQYRFVQSVIREVAYSTLSKNARRTKHLACARWIESQGEDDLAGVIASHYLDAYRADPGAADARVIAADALRWVRMAGDRALTLGSPEQAIAYFRQGLELTDDARERAALLTLSVTAGRWVSSRSQVWQDASEAIRLMRDLDDLEGEARVLVEAGRLDAGPEGNVEIDRRTGEIVSQLGDDQPTLRASLLTVLADRCNATGRREEALDYSEKALVLAQSVYDDEVLGAAAAARGWAVGAAGRHFEARLLWEAVVELARQSGSSSEVARALMQLSTFAYVDDQRAAVAAALEAAEHAAKVGSRALQQMTLSNTVEALLDIGEWDRAIEVIAEVEALGHFNEDNANAIHLGKAELAALHGDADVAEASLEELSAVLDESRGSQLVQMRTWFLRIRALAALLADQPEAVLDDLDESLRLDPSGSNAPLAIWLGVQAASQLRRRDSLAAQIEGITSFRGRWIDAVRRSAVACRAGLDGDEEAVPLMADILQTWLDMRLPLDHASTVICAGWVLGADRVPAGHAQRARAYLEQLGAAPYLRRMDDAGL